MTSGRRIVTFERLSIVLLVLQSVVLLQFPLLNVLGLEFSVASAPLVALLAGLAMLRSSSPDDGSVSPYRQVLLGLRSTWTWILLPAGLALLNAAFVRNCDPFGGAAYYLLIVPFAALFAMSLALLARVIAPRAPRSMMVLLWFLTLLHVPAVTFLGPQIFAYNPIVGFFPGFSYDTTQTVFPTLALFRGVTLVLVLALLGTVRSLQASGPMTVRTAWRSWRTAAAAWALVIGVWFASDALGFSSSLSRIRKELGGLVETEHFIILYPEQRLERDAAVRLGEYHEFLYHALSSTLRVRTSRRIIVSYYGTVAQKSALAGGGGTNFTKPWLWQMHLVFDDRERVLKHELVHVLAAEFGFPVVRVGLNAGFIEGTAVALEREAYGMPLDRAAAAILHARGSVDLSSVFSLTGFFRSHTSVSYTLAGSFCRYLIERYGVRRFKRAYRSGSFTVYGRTFDELSDEWRATIERVTLTEGEMLKGQFLFDRPPGFTEECFQYKGNTLREAQSALRVGNDSLAVDLAREAYSRTPSFDVAYVLTQGLVRRGRMQEALQAIAAQRLRDSATVYLPLALTEGDALWGIGEVIGARDRYEKLARADLSDGWREIALFRIALLRSSAADDDLREMVLRSVPDSVRRSFFRAKAAATNDPLMWYALSRWLSSAEQEDELIDVSARAVDVGEPFLRFMARRRLAGLLRSGRDYEKAKGILWEAQNDVQDEVRLREITETLDWTTWLEHRLP